MLRCGSYLEGWCHVHHKLNSHFLSHGDSSACLVTTKKKEEKKGILSSKEMLPSSMPSLHQACVITSLVYLHVWIS